jgi:hypothetical protein
MPRLDRHGSQVGLTRARDKSFELVGRVASDDEVVYLARRGRTVATLISPSRLAAIETVMVDLSRLTDVSDALVTTFDIEEALGRLTRLVVPWLGGRCEHLLTHALDEMLEDDVAVVALRAAR